MNKIVNATSLDMTLVKGNSRTIVFNVKGNGIGPFDFSEIVGIRWSFFRSLENNAPLSTVKTLGSGIEVTDPEGIFEVTLEPDDTNSVPTGNFLHEAVLIDGGGEVYTVWNGNDLPGKFTLRKIGTPAT